MNFSRLIMMCTQIIHNHQANPFKNMCKLTEEVGELAAETFNNLEDRQAVIDEIADVVICAVCQGEFIHMMPEELGEALSRKGMKGIKNGSIG